MEDHPVELESGETPRRDAEGRFIATEEITNVFVMEKQPGWGEAYPDDKRNGDWDYAWFDAEGTLKHSDPARYEGCFSCPQSRAGRDYTFTFFKSVVDSERLTLRATRAAPPPTTIAESGDVRRAKVRS